MGLKSKTRKAGRIDGQAPEIEFEKVYRDRITGYTGKCVAFVSYISGCDQVLLVPGIDKDGKFPDGKYFDDDRLIDVEAEKRVART